MALFGGIAHMNEDRIRALYRSITLALIKRGMTISVMESCTAGLVTSLLTDTEGASAALKGAFVTYSNEAKVACGVPAEIISRWGVYSTQTAEAMARACRDAYRADIGVGITGSMGNVDPANADSVPGEVFIAIDTRAGTRSWHLNMPPQQTRCAGKLAVAGEVAERLMEVFE